MSTENGYEKYKRKQDELAKLIEEGAESIKTLNMNKFSESLKILSEKVSSESFKIQVVGTFKNGKSTFINSFLGEEVLPAYATPCTAVINELKYGEKPKAILYFKDPLPEKLPSEIPQTILSYMKKYGKNPIPPIEIPYDEIEDYAVIPMGKDPKESLLESPYHKIELFWPLDILKNCVEIIDSPGLNEAETRTRVALEYLSKTDTVIMIFTAQAACSEKEMKFITNNLRQQGFEDIFFVINRFDQLNSDKERARVKNYVIQKLKNETSFGEKGIYFTSAYQALMGKKNSDEALLNLSGMDAFEEDLSNFLINHRGNVKLSQPAKELKMIINNEALFKIIPQQKAMLSTSCDEIKTRYKDVKPKLDAMQEKKRQLAQRITLMIERMVPDITRCTHNFFNDLSDKIPVWVNDYEVTNSMSLLHIKQSAGEIIEEILEDVKGRIEDEQNIWLNNTLKILIEDKVKDMLSSVEQNLENFYVEIDQIRIDISGGSGSETVTDVPLWQRVVGVGGGLLIGDLGLAAAGGAFGLNKEFVKQIAIQIGAYVGLALIGLLNPITIIAVIIGGIIFGGFKQKKQLVEKVKKEVIKNLTDQINQASYNCTDRIVEDVKGKISEFGDLIVSSMDTEINEISIQVEDIIKQLESGEEQVNNRKKELLDCEEKLKVLNVSLDNFIFNLVQK